MKTVAAFYVLLLIVAFAYSVADGQDQGNVLGSDEFTQISDDDRLDIELRDLLRKLPKEDGKCPLRMRLAFAILDKASVRTSRYITITLTKPFDFRVPQKAALGSGREIQWVGDEQKYVEVKGDPDKTVLYYEELPVAQSMSVSGKQINSAFDRVRSFTSVTPGDWDERVMLVFEVFPANVLVDANTLSIDSDQRLSHMFYGRETKELFHNLGWGYRLKAEHDDYHQLKYKPEILGMNEPGFWLQLQLVKANEAEVEESLETRTSEIDCDSQEPVGENR